MRRLGIGAALLPRAGPAERADRSCASPVRLASAGDALPGGLLG